MSAAEGLRIEPIIGLEVHVQLATRTKMFCGCPLEFGAEPNARVCAVCLGLPGALPVINRLAVEYAIRTGLALQCRIATHTRWDRKRQKLQSGATTTINYLGASGDLDFDPVTGDVVEAIEGWHFNLQANAPESLGIIYTKEGSYQPPDNGLAKPDSVCNP